jgi:transcriptional regulator with XRE-family HTH domain
LKTYISFENQTEKLFNLHYFFILTFKKVYPIKIMNIGLKIRKLRELKNYRQEYMAEHLQITQASYSKIESGETDLTYGRLVEIAGVLGIKVEDITNFDEKIVLNNHAQSTVVNGYVNNYNHIEHERQLYQEQITTLKAENEYLKSVINNLLGKAG